MPMASPTAGPMPMARELDARPGRRPVERRPPTEPPPAPSRRRPSRGRSGPRPAIARGLAAARVPGRDDPARGRRRHRPCRRATCRGDRPLEHRGRAGPDPAARLRFRPAAGGPASLAGPVPDRTGVAAPCRASTSSCGRGRCPRRGALGGLRPRAGAELSLVRCTVTIEGGALGLRGGPGSPRARPSPAWPGRPAAATIRVTESLLRGGGDLVDVAAGRRLDLEINAVVATGGSLVHGHGLPRGQTAEPLKLGLRQVTARNAGGLVRLESAPGEPELPVAEVIARDSILATAAQGAPLFRIDGQDALDAAPRPDPLGRAWGRLPPDRRPTAATRPPSRDRSRSASTARPGRSPSAPARTGRPRRPEVRRGLGLRSRPLDLQPATTSASPPTAPPPPPAPTSHSCRTPPSRVGRAEPVPPIRRCRCARPPSVDPPAIRSSRARSSLSNLLRSKRHGHPFPGRRLGDEPRRRSPRPAASSPSPRSAETGSAPRDAASQAAARSTLLATTDGLGPVGHQRQVGRGQGLGAVEDHERPGRPRPAWPGPGRSRRPRPGRRPRGARPCRPARPASRRWRSRTSPRRGSCRASPRRSPARSRPGRSGAGSSPRSAGPPAPPASPRPGGVRPPSTVRASKSPGDPSASRGCGPDGVGHPPHLVRQCHLRLFKEDLGSAHRRGPGQVQERLCLQGRARGIRDPRLGWRGITPSATSASRTRATGSGPPWQWTSTPMGDPSIMTATTSSPRPAPIRPRRGRASPVSARRRPRTGRKARSSGPDGFDTPDPDDGHRPPALGGQYAGPCGCLRLGSPHRTSPAPSSKPAGPCR